MNQAIEILQERFRELNNDLARIVKVSAASPEAMSQYKSTLLALSEAIKSVHARIRAIEQSSADSHAPSNPTGSSDHEPPLQI